MKLDAESEHARLTSSVRRLEVGEHRKVPHIQREEPRIQLLHARGDEVVDDVDARVRTEASGEPPSGVRYLYGDVHPLELVEQCADGSRFARSSTCQDLRSDDGRAPELIARQHSGARR